MNKLLNNCKSNRFEEVRKKKAVEITYNAIVKQVSKETV